MPDSLVVVTGPLSYYDARRVGETIRQFFLGYPSTLSMPFCWGTEDRYRRALSTWRLSECDAKISIHLSQRVRERRGLFGGVDEACRSAPGVLELSSKVD